MQGQQSFDEAENRFSRGHEGKGLLANHGQTIHQGNHGREFGANCLGLEEMPLGAKLKLARFYLIKL